MSANNIHEMTTRQTVIDTVRELMNQYQSIQQMYNLNMIDYNRNVTRFLSVLEGSMNPRTIRAPTSNINRLFTDDDYYSSLLLRLSRTPTSPIRSQGLTNAQIYRHTRLIGYSPNMNESRCPITHEDFRENQQVCQIVRCGHYFKPLAIMTWFENHSICPVCRGNVVEEPETTATIDPSGNNINVDTTHSDFERTTEIESLEQFNVQMTDILNNVANGTLSPSDASFNLMYSFELPVLMSRRQLP